MGEVAMWTGLVTGTLMFASPVLFDRLGWRGVAGATPVFMLWAGMPFFAGVVLYTLLPSTAATTVGPAMLRTLVVVGAIVQVSVVLALHTAYCCLLQMGNTTLSRSILLLLAMCAVDLTDVERISFSALRNPVGMTIEQSCLMRVSWM